MSRKQILLIIVLIIAVSAVIAVLVWGMAGVSDWIKNQTQDIVFAIIMAIVAGMIIEYTYRKFTPKSKILNTTQTHCDPDTDSFAKLVLPNNNNIIVDGAERTMGREDFVGIFATDKLLFIGKDHFKITKENGCFFIQDLKTKNGTMVNGEILKSKEKRMLNDGDEIVIAQTMNIKYSEKHNL
jgi:hypothetical protein